MQILHPTQGWKLNSRSRQCPKKWIIWVKDLNDQQEYLTGMYSQLTKNYRYVDPALNFTVNRCLCQRETSKDWQPTPALLQGVCLQDWCLTSNSRRHAVHAELTWIRPSHSSRTLHTHVCRLPAHMYVRTCLCAWIGAFPSLVAVSLSIHEFIPFISLTRSYIIEFDLFWFHFIVMWLPFYFHVFSLNFSLSSLIPKFRTWILVRPYSHLRIGMCSYNAGNKHWRRQRCHTKAL